MFALRLARLAPSTTRLVHTTPLRLAQAHDVPVAAPHQGIPFEAPPTEDLKGKAVGQVDLPDMAAIERVAEEAAKIVRRCPLEGG